ESAWNTLQATPQATTGDLLKRVTSPGSSNRETGSLDLDQVTLAQIFEGQAERNPHRIAVEQGRVSLTYAELNRKANQLAHLLQHHGLQGEQAIGVYLRRSVMLPIALLATL